MRSEGRAADVVVLGLPEFRLLDAVEVDGELELTVETAAGGWCRGCGVRARSKGRYDTLVRDVVRVREAGAAAGGADRTGPPDRVPPARRGRGGGRGGRARPGCRLATVMGAVWAHGEDLVDDPGRLEGVAALGMDETAWLRANRHHHTRYVSGLVDTASGRLLDVVADRTARAVADWLGRQVPSGWPASASSRSIRTAATPTPSASTSVTPRWSWTTST